MSGVEREDWWKIARPDLADPIEGHEVTFAIHLQTLDIHLYRGQRSGADVWKEAFDPVEYLTGTIDWLEGSWVDDLKTGHWKVDEKTSKQLLSYALVPWILDGKRDGWCGVVSITQWERYPLHGRPQRRVHDISDLDLALHVKDLRWARDNPGDINRTEDGCQYCDCRPNCPEWADEYAQAA